MKKIFTKLTLFALALLGGTQMATADEYMAGVKHGSLGWNYDGQTGEFEKLSGDETETKIDYSSEKPVYLKFTFPEDARPDLSVNVVRSAVLYWTISNSGANTTALVYCGEEFVQTETIKGGDLPWDSFDNQLKTDVSALLKESSINKGSIIFKVVPAGKASTIVVSSKTSLPVLYLDCNKKNEVSYYVSLVDENGKPLVNEKGAEQTRMEVGKENVGAIVNFADLANSADYTKSFYGPNRANQYVYSSSLTNKNGKTSIVVEENGDNTFKLYFTTNAITFDLELTKYPYSTYVNDKYDLDFSSNPSLEAYVVTVHSSDPNYLSLKKVDQVPAGMPVMLKYLSSEASDNVSKDDKATVTVDVVDNANISSSLMKANLLKVFDTEMSAKQLWGLDKGIPYVLVNGGFAKVANVENGSRLAIGTACAFVPAAVAATSSRLTLVEEDEATAVAEAEAQANVENVIYNMQGMRVQNATAPGMYIINGKKVLVK